MNISSDMFSPLENAGNTRGAENSKHPEFDPSPENDKLLWESFKKGSESAFVDIYNQHFQLLYDFGRQFSEDPELVKDCIQEVFITIRMKRLKLPRVSSIKAYLLKAIRNKILTELRDSRKNRFVDITYFPLDFQVAPSPENVLINKQFNHHQTIQIQKSLSLLSQRQREAIYHFYYSGLSYDEIRTMMNFGSTKAARNLIYRALAEIRKTLNNLG